MGQDIGEGKAPDVEDIRAEIRLKTAQLQQIDRDRTRAMIANVDQSRFEEIEGERTKVTAKLEELKRELVRVTSAG